MKHGQRTQTKAKGVKKTTPKKSSVSSSRKESKGARGKESSQRQPKVSVKASETGGTKSSSRKSAAGRGAKPASTVGGGKKSDGEIRFTNPAVANAFKRALKKYPVALKRLSD